MSRGSLLLMLLGSSILSGCLDAASPGAIVAPNAEPAPDPVVIAILDTGINPYHADFEALAGTSRDGFLATLPKVASVGISRSGSYEERRAADAETWRGLEERQLYAFPGTRILGISFGRETDDPVILDDVGHGTATAALAAREAPGAILVAVQIDSRLCDPYVSPPDCESVFEQWAEAMEWVADQEWIDVVSTSLNLPANPPTSPHMEPRFDRYVEATRVAHAQGKVLVNSAGNHVVPPGLSHVHGLPWIITVGGFEPGPRGEAPAAAKAPDVVANYSELVASGFSVDGRTWSSGTSFGTPIVAGVMAKALAEVRPVQPGTAEATRPPGAALWAAMNASSALVAPTAWDPTTTTRNDTGGLLSRGLPVVLSPAQMGWGYVHGGLADEIARRVLEGDLAPPAEKALTASFMEERQRLREEYWARAAPS